MVTAMSVVICMIMIYVIRIGGVWIILDSKDKCYENYLLSCYHYIYIHTIWGDQVGGDTNQC